MLRLGAVFVLALIVPMEARAQVVALPESDATRGAVDIGEDLVTIAPDGRELSPSTPSVAVQIRTASSEDRVHIQTGVSRVRIPVMDPSTARATFHDMVVPRTELLCVGTCELRLGVGLTYTLNLGRARALSPRSASRVRITERTIALDVRFEAPRKERLRRWLSIGGLPLVGAIMMGVAVRRGDDWCARHADGSACDRGNRHAPLFWSGVAVTAAFPFVLSVPFLARGRTVITAIESEN